ncbi:Sodium/hydrogen exchanger 6, partial [Cucurbita argyrosperma subsp. sororia]
MERQASEWVLLIGGSTGTMLEVLQVVGGNDNHEYALTESTDVSHGYITHNEEGSSRNKTKRKLKEFHESSTIFTSLNRNYLTPFFKSRSGDDEENGNSRPIRGS